ncbi:MAG: alpha/beta hydrolase [Desulfofustis sp.]|nr:alpha/beta hydrolase [Desulfofustis sp.]
MKDLLCFGGVLLFLSLFPGLTDAQECVVLLHGLARSDGSMEKMADRLKETGFVVINHDYPSTKYPIEELSRKVIPEAAGECPEKSKIHFVTHSLGGILVRYYLEYHELDNLGRVVMLGPPNKGSQVVDAMAEMPGFELLNGPAGLQLGTEPSSLPNRLGAADFEVGIIAGTRSINLILSQLLPNPDDGKVSVESTKLVGMSDHVTVPVSHPFLMNDDKVIRQTIHFLRYGQFWEEADGR